MSPPTNNWTNRTSFLCGNDNRHHNVELSQIQAYGYAKMKETFNRNLKKSTI